MSLFFGSRQALPSFHFCLPLKCAASPCFFPSLVSTNPTRAAPILGWCQSAGEPPQAADGAVKGERRGKTQKRSTFGPRHGGGASATEPLKSPAGSRQERSGPRMGGADAESQKVGSRQTRGPPQGGSRVRLHLPPRPTRPEADGATQTPRFPPERWPASARTRPRSGERGPRILRRRCQPKPAPPAPQAGPGPDSARPDPPGGPGKERESTERTAPMAEPRRPPAPPPRRAAAGGRAGGKRSRRPGAPAQTEAAPPSPGGRTGRGGAPEGKGSNLVDPASSHMLVLKIKPCMSKYKHLYCETANGSLNQQ